VNKKVGQFRKYINEGGVIRNCPFLRCNKDGQSIKAVRDDVIK